MKTKPIPIKQRLAIEKELSRFHNPEVLKNILSSRPDVDWVNAETSQLREVQLAHPEFTGSLDSLMHKTFMISHPHRMRTNGDVEMFLWFALEDEMLNRGKNEHSVDTRETDERNPEQEMTHNRLLADIRKFVEGLSPLNKRTIRMRFWRDKTKNEIREFYDKKYGLRSAGNMLNWAMAALRKSGTVKEIPIKYDLDFE